jgi:hypothetical protein
MAARLGADREMFRKSQLYSMVKYGYEGHVQSLVALRWARNEASIQTDRWRRVLPRRYARKWWYRI